MWTGLSVHGDSVSHEDRGVRVPRRSRALVGDFDGDGCSDILWQRRGHSSALTWWGGVTGFTVGGKIRSPRGLRPVSGDLGGRGDAVLWWSRHGRERLWQGTGRRHRPFARVPVQQVQRVSAPPAIFRDGGSGAPRVVWPSRGTRPSRLWMMKGGSRPTVVRTGKVALGGLAVASGCGDRALLHRPKRPGGTMLSTRGRRVDVSPLPLTQAFDQITATGSTQSCAAVFHGPRSGGDVVWLPGVPGDPGDSGDPSSHPRIYLTAENIARLQGLLAGSDPAAVRFKQLVDSSIGRDGTLPNTDIYGYLGWQTALMGAVTGEPRYCQDAVRRVEHQVVRVDRDTFVNIGVVAEEARIAAGVNPEVAGDQYLEVGDKIGNIMLVLDWCYDTVTPGQRARWTAFANQAVWNVWHHESAQWGGRPAPWPGWSVDNPFNNYYYSFLEATMLTGLATMGENPQADDWIAQFRTTKIANELVPAFNQHLAGGGSQEGTGYGIALKRLWWIYELWQETTGERIADLSPHPRESIAYLMHQTMPTMDKIAPIGDHSRDQTAALFDYHREYALGLRDLYPADAATPSLRTWLAEINVRRMGSPFQYVVDFLHAGSAGQSLPLSRLRTTYFGSGTGHLATRSSWDRDATWVGFNMGPFLESHAHQDQLSFLMYDDEWLADDANRVRGNGLMEQTDAHNLVDVRQNGVSVPQVRRGSSQVLRLAEEPEFTYAAGDATSLYGAGSDRPVSKMQREIVFLRRGVLVVYDRVAARTGTTLSWLLNTSLPPTMAGSTATIGGTQGLVARSILPVDAATTVQNFGTPTAPQGSRVERTVGGGTQQQFLNVLSVDAQVTSVEPAHDAARDGVRITFTDGSVAVVQFERGAVGGNLGLSGPIGTRAGPLPTGIEAIPIFAPGS